MTADQIKREARAEFAAGVKRERVEQDEARRVQLRAWAAWNDQAYEEHGTEFGIAARREANRIMDRLEPLSEADWGVIRNAQREYVREAS